MQLCEKHVQSVIHIMRCDAMQCDKPHPPSYNTHTLSPTHRMANEAGVEFTDTDIPALLFNLKIHHEPNCVGSVMLQTEKLNTKNE